MHALAKSSLRACYRRSALTQTVSRCMHTGFVSSLCSRTSTSSFLDTRPLQSMSSLQPRLYFSTGKKPEEDTETEVRGSPEEETRKQMMEQMLADVKRKRAEQLAKKGRPAGPTAPPSTSSAGASGKGGEQESGAFAAKNVEAALQKAQEGSTGDVGGDIESQLGEYKGPSSRRGGPAGAEAPPKTRWGRRIFFTAWALIAGTWFYIRDDDEKKKAVVAFIGGGFLKILADNIEEDGASISLNLLLGIMATSDQVCHDFLDMGKLDAVFDRILPAKQLPGEAPPPSKEEEQMTAAALITTMCEHQSVRKRLLKDPTFVRKVLATAGQVNGQLMFATLSILYKFFPEPEFKDIFMDLKGPEYIFRQAKTNPEAAFFFQTMIAWWCCAVPKYLSDNKEKMSMGDKLTISDALYANAINYEQQQNTDNAIECLRQVCR